MTKTILAILISFCFTKGFAQNGYIVLKKRQQSIEHFWKDSHFTFQMRDKQWITGIITNIKADSFYFTQEIIRYYGMGTDTLHFSGFRFALTDVYALPTKNEEIVYENDQVRIVPGHEKFVWVRNGLIFMIVGGGYVGLSVINDLIQKEPPFAKNNLPGLAIGAGVFLVGLLLHFNYDPYIHIGKKYRLECVPVSAPRPF